MTCADAMAYATGMAPPILPEPSALTRRRSVAETVAREAAAILVKHRGRITEVAWKGQVDLVTIADRESEAQVVGALAEAFPEDRIAGEEGGAAGPADADFVWYVDPLDGTTNFVHGLPHFAVRARRTMTCVSTEGAAAPRPSRRATRRTGEYVAGAGPRDRSVGGLAPSLRRAMCSRPMATCTRPSSPTCSNHSAVHRRDASATARSGADRPLDTSLRPRQLVPFRPQKLSATGSKNACGWRQTGHALGGVVPSWMWPQLRQRQ